MIHVEFCCYNHFTFNRPTKLASYVLFSTTLLVLCGKQKLLRILMIRFTLGYSLTLGVFASWLCKIFFPLLSASLEENYMN
jgi:hypothetical protein